MTQTDSNLVIRLIPLGLGQSIKELGGKPFGIFFSLKTETILEFLRLGLFHSIIADQNKQIFEKVMLSLNK